MDRKRLGSLGKPFAQGVAITGQRMVFISGQTALDANGKAVAAGDFDAQFRYVFNSIEMLLKEAGGSLKDIVKITGILSSLDDYGAYNKIRHAYFAEVFGENLPASTTLEAKLPAPPECLLEVDAIAVLQS